MILPGTRVWHDTVSALSYSLAQVHGQGTGLGPPYNDITEFVCGQHGRLTDYLRGPLALATLLFDLEGLLRNGKPFHRLPPQERWRQINRWRNSRFAAQRDLIRYFESLGSFALYSRSGELQEQAVPGVGVVTAANAKPPLTSEQVPASKLTTPANGLSVQDVVIGSGPGGSVTACLLAEAGRDVLLIEEGPFLPLDSCVPFSQQEMLQKYRNGGQTLALGKSKIAYVEARCIGGGSEINSGLYHRTPPQILDHWRKDFLVEGASEEDLAPHFQSIERDLSVSLLPYPAAQASKKLACGSEKLGWKSMEVPRWFRYDQNQEGPGTGRRQSMTETFVPRFLKAGGKLSPCTSAIRLSQEGSRWLISASHEQSGKLSIAAENVFLCAGAIQSPALLRRSGITANIGDSLQVHPTVKVVAAFEEDVNSAEMGVPVHQVKEFSPRISLGCSISTPAHLVLGLLDHASEACRIQQSWKQRAVYYAMITSQGRGTVRALPRFRDPLVRYALTGSDRQNLAEGLNKLGQVLFQCGAVALYPSLPGYPVIRNFAGLEALPGSLPKRNSSLMTIHLFSSCPMGEDRSKCATDSFGRVHSFQNLFVNDASLLCTAPGVNPQGTIMALARRNTLHFLASQRHQRTV